MLPLTLEHPPQHMTPTPPPTSPWRNKNQPGGSSQHWQWWSEEEAMSAEGEEEKPGFGAPICRLHNDFILFWKSVILWRVGCNQRFLSLLFEHARCWIADCCLFALRLGYEIKSLCLLLELYVFVRVVVCLFLDQNTNFTCGNFVCKFVFCGFFFCGHLAKVFLELLYPCKFQRVSRSRSVVETKKMVQFAEKRKKWTNNPI